MERMQQKQLQVHLATCVITLLNVHMIENQPSLSALLPPTCLSPLVPPPTRYSLECWMRLVRWNYSPMLLQGAAPSLHILFSSLQKKQNKSRI